MKLTREEVEHIATLARLRLTEEEKDKYSEQLSAILDYMEKMQAVDTAKVEETSQVTGLKNVMREDVVDQCDNCDEIVECSPSHENGYIKVNKILENK